MATFSGGETLVNTVFVNATNNNGGSVTHYTVPASTYAKVYIQQILFTGATEVNIGGPVGIPIANSVGGDVGILTTVATREIIISSSQTITSQASGGGEIVNIRFFVREFSIP